MVWLLLMWRLKCVIKLPDNLRKTFLKSEEEPYDAMVKKLKSAKDTQIPTAEHWFLCYEVLDMVLKQSDNPDYNYMHKQFVQNMLKKVCDAWESYFEQVKDYKIHPDKYTGKPKIPKYKKCSEMTAAISGKYLVLKKGDNGTEILFPYQKIDDKKVRGSVIVNNLPEEKIAKAEIEPFHGRYRLILTFGEPEEEEEKEHNPKNIMGIDPGVNNFATITDNLGNEPIIIKGGFMKARNQYFNKIYKKNSPPSIGWG